MSVLCVLALTVTACASGDSETKRHLSPGDFAAAPAQRDPARPDVSLSSPATDKPVTHVRVEPSSVTSDSTQGQIRDEVLAAPAVASSPSDNTTGGTTATRPTLNTSPLLTAYTMTAMVGQVNGRPIYADDVFLPLEEQLVSLGERLPRVVFHERAKEMIVRRLDEIVTSQLILGEAEGDLSEQERMMLKNMLKERREALLNQYQGARAVTEEELLRTTGRTLEQTLDDQRQQLVVQRLLQQKVVHKINITRRDIKRYYLEHQGEFNPPARRTIHMIRATSEADAKYFEQQLALGTPFLELATDRRNRSNPDKAGLLAEDVAGDEVIQQPLNDEMLKLKQGEHSPQIQVGSSYAWIYVAKFEQPQQLSLRELQVEIEQRLRRQQFQVLTQQYRRRLYETGNFTPLQEMAESLLQVAMSRYAAVQ